MSETHGSTAGSHEHSDAALAERAPVGWGFWLWWVLASAVGFTVAAAADNAVSEALDFVVYGVPVGVTQWLVLRRQVSRAGWWILATLAAFAVGESLRLVVDDAVSDSVALALVGITQWIVLRRQVSRAGWWILATIAGFAGGESLRLVVNDSVAVGELLGMAVALAVFGAITGGALVWLLRQRAPRGGEAAEA